MRFLPVFRPAQKNEANDQFWHEMTAMAEEELLRPDELDNHVANGSFRLAFVGMSNAGKSYRSRVLQSGLDFFWYEVDACIQKTLGFAQMEEISGWLGFPTSPTYVERADQYLAAEEECTHLAKLDTGGKNLVFDTTGSVIYLSAGTQQWLHDECLIVHIDVGDDSVQELVEQYFAEPKPVMWGDSFDWRADETAEDAMRRCYPELLRTRLIRYRELAHVSIPHEELFDTSAKDTLTAIKHALATTGS